MSPLNPEALLGNPTLFNVLVPDRASVWQALAALFRIELLDPRGVAMGDITDLFDIVRFCRRHGENVEVPVQSSGRCSLATLATLFERAAQICQRLSPQDLAYEVTAIQDFSIVFGYRSKDSLTESMIASLRPISANAFVRRYVSRGAVDPDSSGVSYSCEVELIDPFDLKQADQRHVRSVQRHLENPDAYVNDRARVESFLVSAHEPDTRGHITISLNFEAGFIAQYALRTMEILSKALPTCGIYGGTPDDAALPAAVPLTENNLYTFRFQPTDKFSSCDRALSFLDVTLQGGLFGDVDSPPEEIASGKAVMLRLANGGHDLLRLKDHLARGSEIAQIIDEAVLRRGVLDARSYRSLCRAMMLGGLDIQRLWLATHASVSVRDPGSSTATGATLVRALEAYSTFRAQAFHDFPENRRELQDVFDSAPSRPAHISIDRDAATGECSVAIDVHWSFNGYLIVALEQLARDRGFTLGTTEGAGNYVVA